MAGSLCAPYAVARAAGTPNHQVSSGGVVATVTGAAASLGNERVARRWSLTGGVRTEALTGPSGSFARPGPDFTVDINGVPTTSALGWRLIDVTAMHPAARPGRPLSSTGAGLHFRYSLVAAVANPGGVELDRDVVLHPGNAAFETHTTLVNHSPAALRIASYTLDELAGAQPQQPAEVQAYNGGSDWRDDYRHVGHHSGAFDSEGEVARFGTTSGFFLVSQRRGGAMSRVGRDASGRSWVGVDWARDVFDLGPLRDKPPHYNRIMNPAYPAPIRARVVAPLGSLDLGTSFVGAYSGGAQQAAAEFTRAFIGAAEPSFARSIDINTFHPWSHGDGMSDPNLRAQVDAAAQLGVETFMLDDQWQGGAGGESGDWQFDPARFPDTDHDGVPDFVTYVHDHGLQLGLWMSPVEFNSASTTYQAHPQWVCAPVGDLTAQIPDDAGLGVWDITKPPFQRYLLSVIDRLVHDYGVSEFKFDFMAWVDCAPHDYADYEDAFVAVVHEMQRRHPDVTFELDETNDQRLWAFESAEIGPSWFDNSHLHGSSAVAKLLHDVWTAAPWVPTSTIGMGLYDGTLQGDYAGPHGVDALMPLALLSHVTFWTDVTKLGADESAETRWWTQWYAAHWASLVPAAYELTTADPIDGKSWAAWQPWNGTSGYVFAFRQSGGADTIRLALLGVSAASSYAVTDVRTGAGLGTYTGAALASGLPVTLAPYSAEVLSITPA